MEESKACAIILNKTGGLLLQLRDKEPQARTWVLFGGGVRNGETEEDALRREIKEELNYNLRKVYFFKNYESNGAGQAVFIVADPVDPKDLILRQGLEMKFFPPKEVLSLNLGFNFKEVLIDYFKSSQAV